MDGLDTRDCVVDEALINELIDMNYVSRNDIDRILQVVDFVEAYKIIYGYAMKIRDYDINRYILNTLFIYYLDNCSSKDIPFYYETVLGSMHGRVDNITLEYLLNKELDLNEVVFDSYGCYDTLDNILALRIKSPEIMRILLDKLSSSCKRIFYLPHYEIYTDLCRMNAIAGNYSKALELFSDEEYELYMDITKSTDEIKDGLINNKTGIYIDSLNGYKSDNLYNLLRDVKMTHPDNNREFRLFLIGVLYSKKIKLFNVECLDFIRELLDAVTYNKFLSYLYSMVSNEDIVMYRFGDEQNVMIYVDISDVREQEYTKRRKLTNNN